MSNNLRRIACSSAVVAAALALAARADASSMFQVTDLGNGYTFAQNGDGSTTAVTSGDGGRTYAFDKSPVTSIDQRLNGFWQAPPAGVYLDLRYVTDLLFQNGSHQAGYVSGPVGDNIINTPTGLAPGGDWYTITTSPVADLNSNGEIVGTGLPPHSMLQTASPFATFSTPTGQSHVPSNLSGFADDLDDNLNNYIASTLNINLTSAVKVDDLGRIIAQGTLNGVQQDFLLTPDGLAADPIPTPEPTPIALLVLGGLAQAFRSVRRRRIVATWPN